MNPSDSTRTPASGPSKAATMAFDRSWDERHDLGVAVKAMFDPALGEDMSVRLGAVLDALRWHGPGGIRIESKEQACADAADFLLRTFTGQEAER